LLVVFFVVVSMAVTAAPSDAREVRESGTAQNLTNHSPLHFLLLFLQDILPDLLFSFLSAIFSACFSTFLSIASFSANIACGAL
jgi:hypothetical protein